MYIPSVYILTVNVYIYIYTYILSVYAYISVCSASCVVKLL